MITRLLSHLLISVESPIKVIIFLVISENLLFLDDIKSPEVGIHSKLLKLFRHDAGSTWHVVLVMAIYSMSPMKER